jgi:hypothetical protein
MFSLGFVSLGMAGLGVGFSSILMPDEQKSSSGRNSD